MSAVRSSRCRSWAASSSMPSMPSVPLIRARPSFSASCTGAMPAAASASAGEHRRTGGVAHVALAHQRQRAVRQRGEVAGAAEGAVLADHRRDAGVEQRGVGLGDDRAARRCGRSPASTAAAASARGPPRARPRGRCRRRASGSASAAAGPAARSGCAWWPARRSRSRCRSAGCASSASPSTIARVRAISVSDSSLSRIGAPCRATATSSAGETGPVPTTTTSLLTGALVAAAMPWMLMAPSHTRAAVDHEGRGCDPVWDPRRSGPVATCQCHRGTKPGRWY